MPRPPDPCLAPDEITAITRALADPRRYSILCELAAADAPVPCCALAQAGAVRPSTLSHHLQQLEQAGLVAVSRDGRFAVLRFERDRYGRYLRQLAADCAPRPVAPSPPSRTPPPPLECAATAHTSISVEM